MYWLVWVLALAVIALVGVVFYLYRKTPKIQYSPQENYLEALKALLNNDKTTAYIHLKDAVMADSSNVDAYLRLTSLLRQKGKVRNALQIDSDLNLRQNLSRYEKGEVLLSLAEDYLALNQYDAAEKVLNELTGYPDRKVVAVSRLVKLFAQKKDWKKAFQHQSEYLKLQDMDDKSSLAEFKLKYGYELTEQGRLHEARVEFKDALKFDPTQAEAVVAIGDSYEKDKKLTEAVKAWKRIIEVNPRRADKVFSRVQKVLFELGQYSEIEDFYNQILDKDPKNLQAILGLASMAEKRGEGALAEDYYNQALEINPEFMPALLGLIRFYQRQKRTDEAANVINQAAQAFLQF